MKKLFLITILLSITQLKAQNTEAQNTEVQKAIEAFFEGFHAKDTIKMKSVCSDRLIMQTVIENEKGKSVKDESTKEFYVEIASIPADFVFKEKILKYTIQVDGVLAQVWTPYEFYSNGKLSHSGINAFTLFKENEIWKIIYVIDTRKK